MKKKQFEEYLEKLKKKTSQLDRLQKQLMGATEVIKEQVRRLQKKEVELEAKTEKESILLETIKPDFLTKLQKQDIEIESLKLHLDSLQKLQETIVEEFKYLKGKIEIFDYKKIVSINKEMNEKLKKTQRCDAEIEKNTNKIKQMFEEFEKNYVEFNAFKALGNRLENSFEAYTEKFDSLKESFDSCVKEKDLLRLKKDLEKAKEKMDDFAKKKDVEKLKRHRKGWLF